MGVEIKWIGHASFRIAGAGTVVYIDPWKLTDEPHDADMVFVSHSHFDHCSAPDIQKVSKDDTTIVAPADAISDLRATNAVTPEEKITVKDVTVEPVAAYNISKSFHPKGNHWLGAVFTIDGKRIYYAGDTDLIPEMSDLKDVDVALLPVGGTYTLTAAEAADACKAIGCKTAIPYHWGEIVGSAADAEKFAKAAACEAKILQPGESVSI
ncbi:MAG: MBL fold metallo-hydrolase [Planctomycetota bacterium]|jgi:L-ascorbate metabolism protein UlaG (beta-lactamase superfamily)